MLLCSSGQFTIPWWRIFLHGWRYPDV